MSTLGLDETQVCLVLRGFWDTCEFAGVGFEQVGGEEGFEEGVDEG